MEISNIKVVQDFRPPSLRGKTLQKPGLTSRTWRLGGSIENLNLPQHLDRDGAVEFTHHAPHAEQVEEPPDPKASQRGVAQTLNILQNSEDCLKNKERRYSID